MRFKNGHHNGCNGSYFQYGCQNTIFFSKCFNAPITKEIDISGVLEECDCDHCDFKMVVILAAIFKMATKMRKISKCSNFNENWYVGYEECDSDKSNLKMVSYLRLIL